MTAIPYLDEVVNAEIGCSGKGCVCRETCWARGLHNKRHKAYLQGKKLPLQYAKPFEEVQFFPERLEKILHWKKSKRIGISFTGDLFDEGVPQQWIVKVLDMAFHGYIDRGHQFFFLTKQPERMAKEVIIWAHIRGNKLEAIEGFYFGITCCTQPDLDRMMPDLLKIPGKTWISLEPILEDLEISLLKIHKDEYENWREGSGISWVVVGSHNNRGKQYPFDLKWVENVVEQCKSAGVPVWVKQLIINNKLVRDVDKFPEHLRIQEI